MNALFVQMRIQKIDFNKFLYEINVFEFDTSKCQCERNEQSIFHVFMNCSTYHKLKKKREKKKNHRKQNHFEKFFENINEFTLCKKNNDIYVKNKFN